MSVDIWRSVASYLLLSSAYSPNDDDDQVPLSSALRRRRESVSKESDYRIGLRANGPKRGGSMKLVGRR